MKHSLDRAIWLALLLGLASGAIAGDHDELEVTLQAPFRAENVARSFVVQGQFPGAADGTRLFAQIVVRDPSGNVVSVQAIERPLASAISESVSWPPPAMQSADLAPGFYTATLQATALASERIAPGAGTTTQRVLRALEYSADEVIEQQWDFQVGVVAPPELLAFGGLSRPGKRGAGPFPYTVYLGNFHSQSNHSDG